MYTAELLWVGFPLSEITFLQLFYKLKQGRLAWVFYSNLILALLYITWIRFLVELLCFYLCRNEMILCETLHLNDGSFYGLNQKSWFSKVLQNWRRLSHADDLEFLQVLELMQPWFFLCQQHTIRCTNKIYYSAPWIKNVLNPRGGLQKHALCV